MTRNCSLVQGEGSLRTLIAMRHAKAEASHPKGDYSRELTGKGRNGAQAAAEMLRSMGVVPDFVITSSAARALQTAQIVAEVLAPGAEVAEFPELYLAPAEQLLAGVQRIADERFAVLLVAHNPGMMNLINAFLPIDDHMDVPTSGFAVIRQQTGTWREFSPGVAAVTAWSTKHH